MTQANEADATATTSNKKPTKPDAMGVSQTKGNAPVPVHSSQDRTPWCNNYARRARVCPKAKAPSYMK